MMQRRIAGLTVDVAPPERSKFKSPLILIHGLWSGSGCWSTWATHFSNLGWECWAINFRGRTGEQDSKILERLSFQDCLEDLKEVIAAAPFPPVLMGHDLGGLIAQKAAEEETISAVVLVAPIPSRGMRDSLPRALGLLRLKYWPLIMLGRPFCLQEKDFRRFWLAPLDEDWHPEILRTMVPDSSRLIKELFNPGVEVDSARVHSPLLFIAGDEDKVVSASSLREMALRFGADFKSYPGNGHWMMGEQGGKEIVRDIHRWVVQKLGEEILFTEQGE